MLLCLGSLYYQQSKQILLNNHFSILCKLFIFIILQNYHIFNYILIFYTITLLEVFVTECDGKNSLCQKVALLMDDANGVTRIGDDRTDAVGQSEMAVNFLQQHNSGIRGQLAAIKIDFDGQWFLCRDLTLRRPASIFQDDGLSISGFS